MSQTKRKRRTKHRGNAAGMVEVRGRTGKPPAGAPARNGSARSANGKAPRGIAPLKPPTMQGAALKAVFGVVILFVFFRFLSKGNTTGQALAFCLVAFLLYTPVMYFTDKFIYQRKLRQRAAKR
jgi:hypothetical protein